MDYGIIYADPPWDHAPPHISDGRKSWYTEGHKLNQATLEAGTLPIATPAILFLWVPPVILDRGVSLLKAWGFKYDGEIVWVKVNKDGVTPGYGMGGHLIKYTHECLLVGIRGKLRRFNDGVLRSAFMTQRMEAFSHGKKPDVVYPWIEQTAAIQGFEPPFLELFARRPREGWHTYGNTIDNAITVPEWAEPDERG